MHEIDADYYRTRSYLYTVGLIFQQAERVAIFVKSEVSFLPLAVFYRSRLVMPWGTVGNAVVTSQKRFRGTPKRFMY